MGLFREYRFPRRGVQVVRFDLESILRFEDVGAADGTIKSMRLGLLWKRALEKNKIIVSWT